jgi:hypothetical protein
MGLDFGMTDSSAWVVLGSPPGSHDIYVLHARKEWEMLPDEVAAVTAELIGIYGPDKVVGDASGKAYIAEWNRRHGHDHGVFIQNADKTDKVGSIALFNGDMRGTSPIRFLPAAQAYAYECQRLPWKDSKREKEHPGFDNHTTDAGLYAWKAHRAYLAPVKGPPPKATDLVARREAKKRAERMQARRSGGQKMAA